jgi:hypothetical protein
MVRGSLRCDELAVISPRVSATKRRLTSAIRPGIQRPNSRCRCRFAVALGIEMPVIPRHPLKAIQNVEA